MKFLRLFSIFLSFLSSRCVRWLLPRRRIVNGWRQRGIQLKCKIVNFRVFVVVQSSLFSLPLIIVSCEYFQFYHRIRRLRNEWKITENKCGEWNGISHEEQMKTELNAWNFHINSSTCQKDLRNFYIFFIFLITTVVNHWLNSAPKDFRSLKLSQTIRLVFHFAVHFHLNLNFSFAFSLINTKLFNWNFSIIIACELYCLNLNHRHHHHCRLQCSSSYINQFDDSHSRRNGDEGSKDKRGESSRTRAQQHRSKIKYPVNIYDFKWYRIYGTSTSMSFSSQQ